MSLPAEEWISPQEYLRRERLAETKSEYHAGRVFAMAGASSAHCQITANLTAALVVRTRSGPCRTFSGDLRVLVDRSGLYCYPDVTVLCGEPVFFDSHHDTLLNPTLIVEVLSPSTEQYDRGAKFGFYRTLESLKEILFVAQDRPSVERYVRRGRDWLLTETSGLDADLHLETMSGAIPLADLYDQVDFPVHRPATGDGASRG